MCACLSPLPACLFVCVCETDLLALKTIGCSVCTCLHYVPASERACVCVCPWTNAPSLLQLTSRWMLAVTPAWLCSCQMRRGHRDSAQTLINLNHCPTFFRRRQQLPISTQLLQMQTKMLTYAEAGWPNLLTCAVSTEQTTSQNREQSAKGLWQLKV